MAHRVDVVKMLNVPTYPVLSHANANQVTQETLIKNVLIQMNAQNRMFVVKERFVKIYLDHIPVNVQKVLYLILMLKRNVMKLSHAKEIVIVPEMLSVIVKTDVFAQNRMSGMNADVSNTIYF